MKKSEKKNLLIGSIFLAMFAVWTALIQSVDVQPLGQNGTSIGFATFNCWFHHFTGVNMAIYTITDWMGLVPVVICLIFAGIGLVQLIKRRSLFRVDADIMILGVYFVIVFLAYAIFEMIPINYRPILIEGVSFNKIFAKLGSDMKKPDAITCIEADSFREKIWCLPASDLLGVGRATEKVLSGYGIHTIGELAATSDDFLKCRLGKNGLAIKKYANGLDDSPVMLSDYVSPVKSIGHGITTMQDLENNAEVWCVMLELVQEIGTKLRTHKKKAGGIAISIRNNELFTKEWQCRISIPTQSPTYLAKTAFALFDKNYQWEHPIRSVTVRAINLFEEDCPIQYDLFTDVKSLDRQERLDAAIEQIRFRFGKDAIKNGVLFQKSKMPTERKVDLVMPTGMIG